MKKFFIALCAVFVSTTNLVKAEFGENASEIIVDDILSTLLYSAIGIVVATLALLFIDLITPGNLRKQLTEERNVALAIVAGSTIVGVCLLIAASII